MRNIITVMLLGLAVSVLHAEEKEHKKWTTYIAHAQQNTDTEKLEKVVVNDNITVFKEKKTFLEDSDFRQKRYKPNDLFVQFSLTDDGAKKKQKKQESITESAFMLIYEGSTLISLCRMHASNEFFYTKPTSLTSHVVWSLKQIREKKDTLLENL